MWYYIVCIVISGGLVKRKQDWESPGTRSVIVIGQERRNDHDHKTDWERNWVFCFQHMSERPSGRMWVLAGVGGTPTPCKRHLSSVEGYKRLLQISEENPSNNQFWRYASSLESNTQHMCKYLIDFLNPLVAVFIIKDMLRWFYDSFSLFYVYQAVYMYCWLWIVHHSYAPMLWLNEYSHKMYFTCWIFILSIVVIIIIIIIIIIIPVPVIPEAFHNYIYIYLCNYIFNNIYLCKVCYLFYTQ